MQTHLGTVSSMNSDEEYMRRCLELAAQGFNEVRPNPMVGAVLVANGAIIGEGYHRRYGGPHAEVEALQSVGERALIPKATMYVSLEPCNHTGKTPPCVDAILSAQVQRVVIGARDTNPKAHGGLDRLRAAGVDVSIGVLEAECRFQNRRFFTFHEAGRPYVILKWAQTADGFIARSDYSSQWISGESSRRMVHEWRSQEAAVLIGTMTAIHDNPKLTARIPGGRNPIRVVIDRQQKVPTSFHVFDESAPTILYNEVENYTYPAATLIKLDFSRAIIPQILADLRSREMQSVIVEGGANTIAQFLALGLWDEARVFTGAGSFGEGIAAPVLNCSPRESQSIDSDRLEIFFNPRPAKM